MDIDSNDPPLGTVYAVPLSGLLAEPGRWGVIQVVSKGDQADLGNGPVKLGMQWGCTVIGFDAVFDAPPSIEDLDEVLKAEPIILQTVITFAHSDLHWELIGPSAVQVKVPVPLYGMCVQMHNLCFCSDIVKGVEFTLPIDECENVYHQEFSTQNSVSDTLIIAMEVEPEFSELMKEIADPKYFYRNIIGRFRTLDL